MGQLLSIFSSLQRVAVQDAIPNRRKRPIEEETNVSRKKPCIETIVVVDSDDEDTLEQFFGPQDGQSSEAQSLVTKSHNLVLADAEAFVNKELWLDNQLSLTQIENDRIYQTHFSSLCNCYFKTPDRTWVIDFEFQPLANPMWAVPYELSIRTIKGDFILTTHVDYGMTREELTNLIKPYLRRIEDPSTRQMKKVQSRFIRHFGLGKTCGMTIPDIKAAIEALGYNHEFVLLGWGNYVDVGLFHRIMNGHAGPTLQKWPFKPFPCHVSQIARRSLRKNRSQKLETVHKALCPHISRRYHEADHDVLAMTEVIRELVHMRHTVHD